MVIKACVSMLVVSGGTVVVEAGVTVVVVSGGTVVVIAGVSVVVVSGGTVVVTAGGIVTVVSERIVDTSVVLALFAMPLIVVTNVEVVPSVVEVNKDVLNRESEVPD